MAKNSNSKIFTTFWHSKSFQILVYLKRITKIKHQLPKKILHVFCAISMGLVPERGSVSHHQ